MTLQELERWRNTIADVRNAARKQPFWNAQLDSVEGCRMVLNACYLHRATGGSGYGFAALRAWAKRNVASRRVAAAAQVARLTGR